MHVFCILHFYNKWVYIILNKEFIKRTHFYYNLYDNKARQWYINKARLKIYIKSFLKYFKMLKK